jgi:DNA gyrase subunit A
MVNLLPLDPGERVTSILPVAEYTEDHFIFMATAKGIVKKTALTDFSRPRSVGLRALELADDDVLVGTAITHGESDVMLMSSAGKAVRFAEQDVRPMGRTARGVRGIRMGDEDEMIALIIPQEDSYVLTASANGYGKKTMASEFPRKGRGTKGVIAMVTNDRNGPLVGAVQVGESDELMLISNQGTMVRTRVAEISSLGRNTQGVRVIRLKDGEELVRITQIDESDELPGEAEAAEGDNAE